MKKSTFKKYLLLICFLIFSVSFGNGQETSGSHMLWEVSSENGTEGYLVGSTHVVKPEIYPLDDAFQQAFNKSDVIGFELSYDSVKVKARPLIQELGIYPKGKTLMETLTKDTYQLLETRLDSLGLPMNRFKRMEPWLISINITVLQLRKAGYSGQQGIDRHFYKKAKEAGKKRMALESVAYQYKMFDNLSSGLQEKFLIYSIKDAKRNIEAFKEIMTAWEAGNTDKLEKKIPLELKNISDELYQTMIIERNHNWIPKIEQVLESSKMPMFVVGAGHLVGSDSVISMLREKGYQIEQM